jgi:hypothetical protein
MEYKQSDFCKAYGILPSTANMAIKRGALQKNTAGLLDDENTVNKIFLAKRQLKITKEALADDGKNVERVTGRIDFAALEEYELAGHAGLPKKLLGMTIRDLVISFKGLDGLERYVKMLRDLAAAEEKDQKTQERRLQLVEKDFVTARLFQYVDDLMKQLLEWAGTSAPGITALVLSGGEAALPDVTREIEKGVGGVIRDAKSQIIKELSGLRAKYHDDDRLEEVKAIIEEAVSE